MILLVKQASARSRFGLLPADPVCVGKMHPPPKTNNHRIITGQFPVKNDKRELHGSETSNKKQNENAQQQFKNDAVIDVFGEITYTGNPSWDHKDGWVYRLDSYIGWRSVYF